MAKKHLHERRGVTFQELGALLAVREMLKMGVLTYEPERERGVAIEPRPGEHLFNMNQSGDVAHCGSVGCIGGNMALVLGIPAGFEDNHTFWMSQYVGPNPALPTSWVGPTRSKPLAVLFFPPGDDWAWITGKVAVRAINNWLENGKPRWSQLKPKAR